VYCITCGTGSSLLFLTIRHSPSFSYPSLPPSLLPPSPAALGTCTATVTRSTSPVGPPAAFSESLPSLVRREWRLPPRLRCRRTLSSLLARWMSCWTRLSCLRMWLGCRRGEPRRCVGLCMPMGCSGCGPMITLPWSTLIPRRRMPGLWPCRFCRRFCLGRLSRRRAGRRFMSC
jgi:hypothetical protein